MKFSIQTIIWTLVIVGILIAAVMAFVPDPVEVETAKVLEGTLRVSVQEDGKTRIREKYVVSSPVAGRLSRIELKPGDEICGDGTMVALIMPADPTMLDARSQARAEAHVEQAQASLNRSRANSEQMQVNFELSETKYERAKKLMESKAISQNEYDSARSEFLANSQAVRTTKFDSEIAEFELKMAEAAVLQFSDDEGPNVEPFEVTAPISGKVLRVFQESATVVAVGTPLMEIGDPQNLEIEIDVLSTDAVRIQPFAELTVEHWGGGEPLLGNVRTIEPAAFTKVSSLGVEEQRVNVIADFREPQERLLTLGDGYRVEARVTINELKNVRMIPNSALFRHQREWHVFTILDEVAQMQPVEVGEKNETHTQVVSGLSQGDEVIVYPSDQIRAGVKVRRVPAGK